jgi:hypothetical protein
MGGDLASQAELNKLARALGTTRDGVAFAKSLDHDDVRRLRERVVSVLYDEHRVAFQRVAAIARRLPDSLNVRIALRAFPPVLAARVAGEMAPARAAEMANRMPVAYLAEACVHLDPRRAPPLIRQIDPARALAAVVELVSRREYVVLGQLLDAATPQIVRDVAATVSAEALLRIGFYAESNAVLTQAVAVLPPQRLRAIVHCAMTGPPDLRSAGLALIARLEDDGLRGQLADYAAEADDEVLSTMLHTAIDNGAIPELLTAVAAMGTQAKQRVLGLPDLTEHDVLVQLVKAVTTHNLWSRLTPIAEHMTDELRRRLTAAWQDIR